MANEAETGFVDALLPIQRAIDDAQIRVMSSGEIDANRVNRLARLVRCIADDDGNSWQGDAAETLLDCGIARSGEIGYPNIMVAAAHGYPHICPRCSGPAYVGAVEVDCAGGCK